jgi:hypothetical protein
VTDAIVSLTVFDGLKVSYFDAGPLPRFRLGVRADARLVSGDLGGRGPRASHLAKD